MREKIFISYSHKDRKEDQREIDYVSEFLEFVKPFQRKNMLSVFQDTDIKAGQEWHSKIQQAIHATKIAVFIISQHFLNSPYIRDHELIPLLEAASRENVVVIPLFLSDSSVDLEINSIPVPQPDGRIKQVSLTDYQGFNDPDDPLNRMSQGGRERIYKDASERLEQLMQEQPRPPLVKTLAFTRSHREPETAQFWVNGPLIQKLSLALKDQCKIKREIFSSSRTVVLSGWDILLNRPVAIKTWRMSSKEQSRYNQKEKDQASIIKKLQFAADLKHRGIITVYSAGIVEEICYIILEYIPGISLERLIQSTGIQPYRRIKSIIQHVGEALLYAHKKGFFHHNLHTTNIMIDQEGLPMVSPFRISSELGSKSMNLNAAQLKTIKYQTPEQWGNQEITEASDQYSLGLIAYEMTQGSLLFDTQSPQNLFREKENFIAAPPTLKNLRPDCPNDLSAVILQMLQQDPKKRFPTLRDALNAWDKTPTPSYIQPSTDQWQLFEQAKNSYERCRQSPHFFREFYDRFFAKQPEIRGKFPANLESQYRILREALELLLLYPLETPSQGQEPNILTKIAKGHGQSGIGVTSLQYEIFTQTLLKTIQDYDSKYSKNPGIENAWRSVLSRGIEYMKSQTSDHTLSSLQHI